MTAGLRVVMSIGLVLAVACGGETAESPGGAGRGGLAGSGGDTGGIGGIGGDTGGIGGDTGGGFSCFVAGTQISTPRGTVAIETLGVGDQVLAFDEVTRQISTRTVAAVMVHENEVAGQLALANGRVLGVTGNHPIYLPDHGRYVRADQVSADARLLSVQHASSSSVIAGGFQVPASARPTTVYNLEVEGLHNYFAEGILVHNKSGGAPPCYYEQKHVEWAESCAPDAPCLDTSYGLASAGLDAGAGFDAGAADAGAVPEGGAPQSYAYQPLCGEMHIDGKYFVAFDAYYDGQDAAFSIAWNKGESCSGEEAGRVHFPTNVTTPGWTTLCTRITGYSFGPAKPLGPYLEASHLAVFSEPATQVKNFRLQENCDCQLKADHYNSCTGTYVPGEGGVEQCP